LPSDIGAVAISATGTGLALVEVIHKSFYNHKDVYFSYLFYGIRTLKDRFWSEVARFATL